MCPRYPASTGSGKSAREDSDCFANPGHFFFRGNPCKKQSHPLRWNLILIAVLIALLNYGNIAFTCVAIRQGTAGQFVIGALPGLLPAGITGLIELGNTMLNEMSR